MTATPHPRRARHTRRAVRAGVVVAAVATLNACGGIADDAPTDAGVEEFCAAYFDGESSAEQVADRLAEVGTPSDISDFQRDGFEAVAEGLQSAGDRPRAEVEEVNVSESDVDKVDEFVLYANETCASFLQEGAPTEGSPTEGAPTEGPSTDAVPTDEAS